MRLALIVPVALMMGTLYGGCAAGPHHDRPLIAYGSYDERQHYPAYQGQRQGQRPSDPAYAEGQRSQVPEGNTR
jgi:hypothetical protein